MSQMIQLYSLSTPNGQKIGIALEEMEIPYDAHTVNIMKGDQFKPEFIKINPNSKIPAIVDLDGPGGQPVSIMESGAILIYLGQKSGKFYPQDARLQSEVLQWLFFQVGEQYTIADMATVPWVNGVRVHYKAEDKLELNKYKNVNAWVQRIIDRPKTKAGMAVCG
jgi:GST-like protein